MKTILGAVLSAALLLAPLAVFAPSSAMAQLGHTSVGGKSCSAGLADVHGPAIPVSLRAVDTATRAAIDTIPMCATSEINTRLRIKDLGGAIVNNPHLLAELHARGFLVHSVVAAGMVGNTLHLFVEVPDHPAPVNEEQHELRYNNNNGPE